MSPGLLPDDSVLPLGPTAAAVLAWRQAGVLRITVIAKATFAIACDTAMPRTRPQPIVGAEVHHDKNPMRSIRRTTDLVPFLQQADVLFTGSAYAPPGSRTESMHARLGLFDGARSILDKSILLQKAGGFREIPIVYERAYGGIGHLGNPLGVGVPNSPGVPSVLDPDDPQRVAGFGPIGKAWPSRRRLVGDAHKAMTGAIPTILDTVPWEYFQAAPADQRTDYLAGDEWIVLDGLHPSLPRARTRLPGARGHARIHGLSGYGIGEGCPLALKADMLCIDGDDRHVTLTFRGVFPVPHEDALAAVRVAVGVELPDEPIAWPNAVEPRAGQPAMVTLSDDEVMSLTSSAGGDANPPLVSTLVLEPPATGLPPRASTLVLNLEAGPPSVTVVAPVKVGEPALPFVVAPAELSPFAVPSERGSVWQHPLASTLTSILDDPETAPLPDAQAPARPAAAPIAHPPREPDRVVSVEVAPPPRDPPAPPPKRGQARVPPPPVLKKGLSGKPRRS